MTDYWKKNAMRDLSNCEDYIRILERDLAEAKKRKETLTAELNCEHSWDDTGSGMQLDIAICRKCGAIDAA